MNRNLQGRRFTENGQPFGVTFIISDLFPESGRAAVVAFDRLNDRYLVAFEVTSVLLLVAVLGAVVLARRRAP